MWFTEGSPSNRLDDTWKAVPPRPLASIFASRATWASRGNTGAQSDFYITSSFLRRLYIQDRSTFSFYERAPRQ
jgi:hypothetical protein